MEKIRVFEENWASGYRELYIEKISVRSGVVSDATEKRLADLVTAGAYYWDEAALKSALGSIGPFYLGIVVTHSDAQGMAHVQRQIINRDPKELDWPRLKAEEFKQYHVGELYYKAYY